MRLFEPVTHNNVKAKKDKFNETVLKQHKPLPTAKFQPKVIPDSSLPRWHYW